MTVEKRDQTRIKVPILVRVTHANFGTIECSTYDISDNGLSLIPPEEPFPSVGEEITVQITKGALNGTFEEPIQAKVIHISEEKIGIRYM